MTFIHETPQVLAEHGITSLDILRKQDPIKIERVSEYPLDCRSPSDRIAVIKSPAPVRSRRPCFCG